MIILEGIIIGLLVIVIIILLSRKPVDVKELVSKNSESTKNELLSLMMKNNDSINSLLREMNVSQTNAILQINRSLGESSDEARKENLKQFKELIETQETMNRRTSEFLREQDARQSTFLNEKFQVIINQNTETQIKIMENLNSSLKEIRETNEMKLVSIQNTVNEKLDKSLNERLDSSFKVIGDRLNDLYKSLGELSKLSEGVGDLNKTLSNVKTRGVFGEMQLENILSQTLDRSQYEVNIITNENSHDPVEFAVKIPAKTDDSYLLLPIDAKMPSDLYNKLVDANTSEELVLAKKELETRIKNEAKKIKEKYVYPPKTTDFAIMFLPTEGLYAEVLRIDGLLEYCQNIGIIISGPTTITALLNSLRLGFSNLALAKKSEEVLKVLQAIKTQYQKFDELLEKQQNKLNDALNNNEKLKSRTNIIKKTMKSIEELDLDEANQILGIKNDEE